VSFVPPGGSTLVAGERPVAVLNSITPGYFETLQIPLLAGRGCSDEDRDGAPVVLLVNDRLAQRLWPNANAVGQRLEITDYAVATVIGVVGGNRHYEIRNEPPWQIHACLGQNPGTLAAVVMRSFIDPATLGKAAQRAVWAVDGDQAVWKIRTLETLVRHQTADQRLTATLASAFSLIALALAVIGVYGVVNYAVSQRTREIGIRMALGARSPSILRLALGRLLVITAIGLATGLCASIGAAQTLRSLLFEISPWDPWTVTGCLALLIVSALLAGVIPASRALRTDPVRVLHYD
jgi:predicted permease